MRQQFTAKERDIETDLDYFGARYFASRQGRFTGVDPYDINLERQTTVDVDEADKLFTRYIGQPQHWNRYVYALNNPLRYIDPDGWKDEDFEKTEIIVQGEKVTVKISKELSEDDRAQILNHITAALSRLNEAKELGDDIKQLHKLNGITVSARASRRSMNKAAGIFTMTAHYALNSNSIDMTAAVSFMKQDM